MPSNSLWNVLRLTAQLMTPKQRLQITVATLLVVLSGALAALAPLALKRLVDAVASAAPGPVAPAGALLAPAAIYVAALCGGRLIGDFRPLLLTAIEQHLVAALRHRFFAHVLRLPLAGLLSRRTGELLHTLDLACAGTQLTLTHLIQSIAPVVIELTVMAAVLLQLGQPTLLALFAATAAAYFAAFTLGARRLNRRAGAVAAASLDVNGQLAEGMANVETLRCFGGETAAQRALAGVSSTLINRWLDYYRTTTSVALAATMVFALSLAACLSISAEGVAAGTLTIGGFVLGTVYLIQMVRPIEALGAAIRDLARASGFVQPALNVLSEPQEAVETAQRSRDTDRRRTNLRRPPAAIRFEAVTFRYDATRTVIQDLDLVVPAGTTTAVVGPSGSGKSTLIRLLLQLYSPQKGRILLDERPIDKMPLHELRSHIALVPQDTPLLHSSIASNISLGMPEVDPQDIVAAAGAARLDAVIDSLPDGYQTLVGERGLKLSGGERQRLAIARAVLRRPSVFLLDEPTSMLDGETQAQVLLALREATEGCTTLIVAHRLSTVIHADEIVVLEHGRIRARGRHHDLLTRDDLYAQLWRYQADGAV
ncbi:ABC transporter ATP-binding protein [Roseateles sp.]|uniref:ABC transporter ATP-binding protein n=1 Tax=Roseateles sp. TaxID=1971397 RepID=UPI0039EB691B